MCGPILSANPQPPTMTNEEQTRLAQLEALEKLVLEWRRADLRFLSTIRKSPPNAEQNDASLASLLALLSTLRAAADQLLAQQPKGES